MSRRVPAFRFVTRHHRRCLESRWQFSPGHEIADRRGEATGKGPFYHWLIARCIGCKHAVAHVRADALASAINLLERR